MTIMQFEICATPTREDGTAVVHLYIGHSEATRTDSPGEERRAMRDAEHVINDIIGKNCHGKETDEEQLLQEGSAPWNALPIFVFAIGVSWNSEWKMPHYSRIGYKTICDDTKFASVYQTGADLYEYTIGVLRKRENADRAKVGAPKLKDDKYTREAATSEFERWSESLVSEYLRRVAAHEANNRRFGCEHYRNGYCVSLGDGTAPDFKCPCYNNGKCMEVKE